MTATGRYRLKPELYGTVKDPGKPVSMATFERRQIKRIRAWLNRPWESDRLAAERLQRGRDEITDDVQTEGWKRAKKTLAQLDGDE